MDFSKVPHELTERKQWVLWKTVVRGEEKTKLPFQPHGESAKSNDDKTWRNFTAVCSKLDGYDGPGFVFSPDDPFVGVDLDGCRNPETEKVEDWAREIIKRFDSYAEISPSGTGIKIFCKGEWRFDGGKKCNVTAESVSSKTPGIEVYAQKRYFAVTGLRLSGISQNVEQRQDAIDWLTGKYFAQSSVPVAQSGPLFTDDGIIERARKYIVRIPTAVSGQSGHNQTFKTACCLVLGFGLPREDALALLREWNQGCQPPWTDRELQHKVDDAGKQEGEKNYLRDAKPSEWDRISVPRYELHERQEAKVALRIDTLEDATRRYVNQVRSGTTETLVKTGLDTLDHAIGGGFELGEMVILAARPSHGKSAVALQIIHEATRNGYPCVMISEEMSSIALGKRVAQFASEVPQEHWWGSIGTLDSEVDKHFSERQPCYVIESCGTADKAVEEIEKAVEERGVKIAFVDYAQLLRNRGKSRYEQVTNTSVALKSLANRYRIAVVVLCQLSREIEKRTKFVPQTSDLKETGQFEQDADVILFLVWPHRINSQNSPNEYLVYVAKNRNREIRNSALKFVFQPSRQKLAREQYVDSGYEYEAGEDYGDTF